MTWQRSALLAWVLVAATALPVQAQAARAPDSAPAVRSRPAPRIPYRVMGQVVVPRGDTALPVPGVWVTLHRVGQDSAGPLDSMRVGADGRYAFRYERGGDPDAVYFVSGTFGGIAYFSEPLRSAFVQGDPAEIMVYDTTSSAGGVRVQGRHLVVSALRDGRRHEIIEVYELSNDSARTVVAPDSTRPVWTTVIPSGAEQFQVSRGDVGAAAVVLRDGRVSLFAPISPGIRQLSFSYFVPARDFPLRIPMLRSAEVLEVLVEDPGARVSGAGLAEEEPATLEGRRFKRFLAQRVDSSAVVRVAMGEQAASRVLMLTIVASLLGLLMIAALARAFWQRRHPPPAAGAPAPPAGAIPNRTAEPAAQALVREIAALDAAFEQRVPGVSAAETSTYEARRDALKQQLARTLARERTAG